MQKTAPYIALGSRMQGVPEVLTLGVKPNYDDYTVEERKKIAEAPVILYPTLNYAQFFNTTGKKIFPSLETYLYADEKIKQTTLFFLLDIPHPHTRFYYRPKIEIITKDFSFPFVAKIPRASARGRGVFLINDRDDLEQYLQISKIAYIQEYIPHERDLRVILVNYKPILAYWRQRSSDNFRTNLYQGGTLNFDYVPDEILKSASTYAKACNFNDVGLDFIYSNKRWYLIEANMQYGRDGLREKGLVLKEILREKLLASELY
jgi:ribosomal protein S6--L-glutamate ligase